MQTKVNKNVFIRNGIIYVQGSINGSFKRYSTEKKDTKLNIEWCKKNWKQALLKINAEKEEQKSKAKDFITFDSLAKLSFESNKYERRSTTNRLHLCNYDNHIKEWFKNFDIRDIKPIDIKMWQNNLLEKDLEINTIKSIRNTLTSILCTALENDIINSSPSRKVKLPKRPNVIEEDQIMPFSMNEMKSILSASTGQMLNMFQLLFFTGMRTGECLGLKWGDINFKSNTIHIQRAIKDYEVVPTKTKTKRLIDLLPLAKEALLNQKGKTYHLDEYIFLNERKTFFGDSKTPNRYFKRILKFCGIDERVMYQCRHTFASMMISNGEDILWVSHMLGHKNLETTMRYYAKYIQDNKKERAVFLNEFKEKNCTITAHENFKFNRAS